MSTKLANPHYLPEVCIATNLINFTVTREVSLPFLYLFQSPIDSFISVAPPGAFPPHPLRVPCFLLADFQLNLHCLSADLPLVLC